MKKNRLKITINKSVQKIFQFTITPPNSTLWIPSVVSETTNEWPIRIGTIYKLTNSNGESSEVIVTNIIKKKLIEWISKDKNYHCRYSFKSIKKNTSELEYYEKVDKGDIKEPFTLSVLEKLKKILENK